jgi:molybdopterin-containing oxidoreductase family iron-sulfur binding subunit
MHWLRIERYWEDGPGGPVPRFLPVMCQHCENAPCEPVCPVFASYHTRDGLNAQIYNRCIGTRYCANNCPYKVRRFNWYEAQWEDTQAMQLNPDVTVRTAGVMEKCTFCVQRIREQSNRARHDGRELKDGEIVPACVQTCPAGALHFGDRLDADSVVSRLAQDKRAYRLLDSYLNNKPAVTYLARRGGDHG